MSDFTPGPWQECRADKDGCACHGIWSHAVDVVVAEAIGPKDHHRWGETLTDEAQVRANARLIAAAPSLVAALEAIYATAIEPDATFSEGAFRDAILNSRALLARIKGESNGDV